VARRSDWQLFAAASLRAIGPRSMAEGRRAMRQVAAMWRRRRSNPLAQASGRLDNPPRKKKRRPGAEWQPDLFGGAGIQRREGLTRAEQLELAREEMRDVGARDLFDFERAQRNPDNAARVAQLRRSLYFWRSQIRAARDMGEPNERLEAMAREATREIARLRRQRSNPADTPAVRYQRAVGHGERPATARKAAANPGRATGRMAPNCPSCGALVRLRNPMPQTVTCHGCGTVSQVRRP
jgi:hypothetical protein